jgi:hypothetical protein
MKDDTWIKLGSIVAGTIIVETCLVLGVDSAGMLIGGALLGVPIGAGAQAALARRALIAQKP